MSEVISSLASLYRQADVLREALEEKERSERALNLYGTAMAPADLTKHHAGVCIQAAASVVSADGLSIMGNVIAADLGTEPEVVLGLIKTMLETGEEFAFVRVDSNEC